MRKSPQIFILIMIMALVSSAQEPESDSECDFSSYKPVVISHAPLGGAVKKVEPEYPAVARAAHVSGEVQVKTLVDIKGNVVRTCAVHGHPLLRQASEKAALEWKFKRNFGFSSKSKFKRKYLQSWIVFRFRAE